MIYPTSQKLADAIAAETCAPEHEPTRQLMIRGALHNHYHDLFGHGAAPITELNNHCMAIGLTALAARVRDGDFDATKEESDAWAASLEGIETLNRLSPGLGDADEPAKEEAPGLGDSPIEANLLAVMSMMAQVVDSLLNGEAQGKNRKNGFVLLVFPFNDHDGSCNYVSNADRADIVVMMKEQIKRFEGQTELVGHA